MTQSRKLYQHYRFIFMTVDPVHIGTGGYRLGRVDMTIAREIGTNLPKLPGTSIAGAARSYAAMRYGKPQAAGQHKKLKTEEKKECPIIYTFGTETDAGGGQAGSVSIGDGHLLFFPVYSMAGPLWISTKERIVEAWGEKALHIPCEPDDEGQTVTSLKSIQQGQLNLGWLLLKTKTGLSLKPPKTFEEKEEWKAIADRIVLVSQKFFSQIVNSNLEVRTSVSIDPATGAAEPGALFTYEAIPRSAWLWCDIVQDNYLESSNNKTFPVTEKQYLPQEKEVGRENAGEELGESWKSPIDVVRAGCSLIEHLGIGGMGTRGFGRMRMLGNIEINIELEKGGSK